MFPAALRARHDDLQHLVRFLEVDHVAQESPHGFGVSRAHVVQRVVDAIGLQASQFRDQRLALGRGEKKALTLIGVAGLLHDIVLVDQLLQHAAERLLGDAQDIEQIGDLQARDSGGQSE